MNEGFNPFGEKFLRSWYFKDRIGAPVLQLYAELCELADNEEMPIEVVALVGSACKCVVKSISSISKAVHLSHNTLRTRLRILESEGWVRRGERPGLPTIFMLGDGDGLFAEHIISERTRMKTGNGGRRKGIRKTGSTKTTISGEKNGPKVLRRKSLTDFGRGSDEKMHEVLRGKSLDELRIISLSNSIPTNENVLKQEEYEVRPLPLPKTGRGWESTPLGKWTGGTLWRMVSEILDEDGIISKRPDKESYFRIKSFMEKRSVLEVRNVAEFFARNFRSLRRDFKWAGAPHPGLLMGFYDGIKAYMDGERKFKRDLSRQFEPGDYGGSWKDAEDLFAEQQ